MKKIELIESITNLKDLVSAGVVSTSLPYQMEIYYHYSKSKSLQKTADEKKVSRQHVYNVKLDFEREL